MSGVQYFTGAPVWYKVRLTVSLKTGPMQVRYFYPVFILRHLSSSVTQHLATFNRILFTKGGFSGTKCTKIVFVFGRGSASAADPAGVATTLPRTPGRLGRERTLLIPLRPLYTLGVSVSKWDNSRHRVGSGAL